LGIKDGAEQIIITNHGDKQYEMYIYLTGEEGEIDFDNMYPSLVDHIIDSIQFIR
jgi:hypothetical protein